MPSNLSAANISGLIKAKRRETGIGLRKATEESGISASTLSRLERGQFASTPDTETLKKLSKWLGVSLSSLVNEKKERQVLKSPKLNTTEQVEVYLRADKDLSPDSADALATAFNVLYKQFTSNSDTTKASKRGKTFG